MESIINTATIITTVAILVSILSAIYAKRASNEAKKANNIGRLNALLALKMHYLQLMENQLKFAKILDDSSKGMQSAREGYAELNTKLRDVNLQINKYHNKIIENKL